MKEIILALLIYFSFYEHLYKKLRENPESIDKHTIYLVIQDAYEWVRKNLD